MIQRAEIQGSPVQWRDPRVRWRAYETKGLWPPICLGRCEGAIQPRPHIRVAHIIIFSLSKLVVFSRPASASPFFAADETAGRPPESSQAAPKLRVDSFGPEES